MSDCRFDVALSRRRMLRALGAGALGVASLGVSPPPAAATPEATQHAIKKLIGTTPVKTGKITIQLPQIAENGHTVPLTVSVDSPMTAGDYVQAIHVLAEGNPNPEVASFYFSPRSGKAEVSTRMRLAKTQNVVALAVLSNGSVYQIKTDVKVTIGGCG
jgi:sulfur-oxidizing protein SoxY